MGKINIFLVLLILSFNSISKAALEDEDYDSIVSRLSTKSAAQNNQSSLDSVMFHMGLSFNNTVLSLASSDGNSTMGHQGYGVTLGIDLLSPSWIAEVGFIDYGRARRNNFESSLKEFDLKVSYKQFLTNFWGLRMGAGLAARYQNLSYASQEAIDYTSPSSILFGGLEAKVTSGISVVTELAYKNTLISETAEKRSLDFLIRLDGHL